MMRADRLISILLLLQQKKKMHVSDLAREMNVSVRTVYRDLLVLSSTGFPVYAEKGPGGGCRIVDDYKSSFSRITSAELEALRMINLPEALSSLEAGKVLQRAMLKLYAASESDHRRESHLFIDWNPWRRDDQAPLDYLELLFRAAEQHCLVRVKFLLWNNVEIDEIIAPYGIAAKAGEWYVVYAIGENIRFRRVKTLTCVQMTDNLFEAPVDFNLETTWKSLTGYKFTNSFPYCVKIKASPEALQVIKGSYWDYPYQVLSSSDSPDKDGMFVMEVSFDYLPSARTYLLGLGDSVEVLEPEPLRWSMEDFARQVIRKYSI